MTFDDTTINVDNVSMLRVRGDNTEPAVWIVEAVLPNGDYMRLATFSGLVAYQRAHDYLQERLDALWRSR
jgi:hypothetical protein